jgi:hypothetical protein
LRAKILRRDFESRLQAEFGAPPTVLNHMREMQADDVGYFGVAPLPIDFLLSTSQISTEALFRDAVTTAVDGVRMHFSASSAESMA